MPALCAISGNEVPGLNAPFPVNKALKHVFKCFAESGSVFAYLSLFSMLIRGQL